MRGWRVRGGRKKKEGMAAGGDDRQEAQCAEFHVDVTSLAVCPTYACFMTGCNYC